MKRSLPNIWSNPVASAATYDFQVAKIVKLKGGINIDLPTLWTKFVLQLSSLTLAN